MVSIIIPCFNTEKSIDRTLLSVLDQSNPDWEVIAVDDGSSDGTIDKLKYYSERDRRISYVHQKNAGVSTARNTGMSHAKGDIIYFLDGDDFIDCDLIQNLLDAFASEKDLVVFGFVQECSENKCRIHMPIELDAIDILKRFLTNRNSLHICSCAFSKSFLERTDLHFDEGTAFSEDREFICRSLFYANSVKVIRKTLYTYKFQADSVMRRKVYDMRKFSSILASERMYKLLLGTPVEKEALIQLKTGILLHHVFICRNRIHPSETTYKLTEIAQRYLPLNSPISIHRDAFFSFVLSKIYNYPRLFRLLVSYL